MKRWRRPLIVIALLLLAGAVVNVAVAWVLGGAPDSWTPDGPSEEFTFWFPDQPETKEELQRLAHRVGVPSDWSDPWHGRTRRGLGWTQMLVETDSPGFYGRGWQAVRHEAGWPARSLGAFQSKVAPAEEWTYEASLRRPRRLLPKDRWLLRYRERLPLSPILAGFAINTIFYAAILALPLSASPIRRRLRARRGRCPKCGYDLTGSAEPAAACPECGGVR